MVGLVDLDVLCWLWPCGHVALWSWGPVAFWPLSALVLASAGPCSEIADSAPAAPAGARIVIRGFWIFGFLLLTNPTRW